MIVNALRASLKQHSRQPRTAALRTFIEGVEHAMRILTEFESDLRRLREDAVELLADATVSESHHQKERQ